jgi:hypothetical protein
VITYTIPSRAYRRAEVSLPEPPVTHVRWRCENQNRYAGGGQTLVDWWLSVYPDGDGNGSVPNVAAYSALSHCCRSTRKTAQD